MRATSAISQWATDTLRASICKLVMRSQKGLPKDEGLIACPFPLSICAALRTLNPPELVSLTPIVAN